MANSYEAIIPRFARELFQDAFVGHMTGLGFDHMTIGGHLGRYSSHEFKRSDDLVSMIMSSGVESDLLVAIHSSGIDVERLVLDALTKGMADFLELFCRELSDQSMGQNLRSLIDDLREAFERVITEAGEPS